MRSDTLFFFFFFSMDMYVGFRKTGSRRSLEGEVTWQWKAMERTGWDYGQGQQVGLLFPKAEWKGHSCQCIGSTDSSHIYWQRCCLVSGQSCLNLDQLFIFSEGWTRMCSLIHFRTRLKKSQGSYLKDIFSWGWILFQCLPSGSFRRSVRKVTKKTNNRCWRWWCLPNSRSALTLDMHEGVNRRHMAVKAKHRILVTKATEFHEKVGPQFPSIKINI